MIMLAIGAFAGLVVGLTIALLACALMLRDGEGRI
jgi:hypothetical protein